MRIDIDGVNRGAAAGKLNKAGIAADIDCMPPA